MQVGGHELGRQAVKLRARLVQGDGFVALRLDGVIDEHNGLDQMVAALGAGDTLLVDLGGVKRLNSVGVRDWVNWLRVLRARFKNIVLFDCPAPVMNEVNFVKNFAEGAHITTFAVPLFCARCNKEESRILDATKLRAASGLALPSFACEKPDCENALDDDVESYFSFIPPAPTAPGEDGQAPNAAVMASERFARLTDLARSLLASGGTPISLAPAPLDPRHNASPARGKLLDQFGPVGRVLEAEGALPPVTDLAANLPSESPLPPEPGGDWLFIAAIAAMLVVLAVLIYLILTLE